MKKKLKYGLILLFISIVSYVSFYTENTVSAADNMVGIDTASAADNMAGIDNTVSAADNLGVSYTTDTTDNVDATKSAKLSEQKIYSSYDYVIDRYDINIVVNEDNTFYITEKIDAYFNISKHGIYRKIPLKNKIVRQDKTTSYNRAKISEVVIDAPFTSSISGGYKVLKIGDASVSLVGEKRYTISYLYSLGKDTGKGYDELYFNLIGLGWDTSIGNITFTITMPKEFDASMLGFSSGSVGTADSSGIAYMVKGNVISGSCNKTLDSGEALTVRLELPDGYFTNVKSNLDAMLIVSMILPILFAIISAVLWFRFGKDEPVIETVEFYPPAGLNSADVGMLYRGSAKKNDVISLLIFLANEGYLEITEIEEAKIFSKKKSFQLTKLKEYEGNNENEQIFFEGLFKNAKDSIVTADDLADDFYTTLNSILKNMNQTDNIRKIFDKVSLDCRFFVVIMIIATFAFITVRPVSEYSEAGTLPYALIFPGVGFCTSIAVLFGKNGLFQKIFGLIFGAVFAGSPWFIMVLPALLVDPIYLTEYLIGLVCVTVMIICLVLMPKRTPYGNEMLGKIGGFKVFLETAEKPKLEELVMEDPNYFYNILPYTYVLGVSDKWIKKFEVIAIERPQWYQSNTAFNMVIFASFMNSTMSNASSVLASSPSSSGSGGTGGGFSGGGSGGGGGGSW